MLKVLACSIVLVLAGAGSAQARPFTAKDLAMLERLSDPHVSPDGRLVAYNLRSTDFEANQGFNAVWVLDRELPGAPPRLVRDEEKSATAPRWSADGRWLYFLSSRSGSTQVWRTPAGGGEARRMTDLPLDVALYRLAPGGRALVAAVDVWPDCATLACSKAKDEARAKEKSTGVTFDDATPRFWDRYLDGRYIDLFAIPLGDGTPARDGVALTRGYKADILARPEGSDASFIITADGAAVIFAARPSGAAQGMGDPSSLYTVPLDASATPRRLDPASASSDSNPAAAPDGTRLAWLSASGSVFTAPRAKVMVRDLKTGATRELAPAFDRSPDTIFWSADSRIVYALAEDTAQERIFAIDAASGAVKPLTGEGHVGALDVAKGMVVFSREALDSPAQIFEMGAGGAARQLTHIDAESLAQTPLSAFEPFSFPGWNGETVHGYVVKPAGFQPGRKYPVAFLIHGGPHGSFGNAWSYRWNPQVWAGMGYGVVMIDFHGSSGYGEAFAKSIIGHWGDRPLEDLRKGWAYALARYSFLDGDRACALGGSYGGYMIAWIAGNWPAPWKCLVDHDGVFDIRLMSYSTDIPGFQQAQNDAPTWATPEAVERFNPIDHVGDWSVPILVVHSGHDVRVPLDQGMGAFGAAQLRHVPSELLYFPDENHFVLKPQNSVQWYATVQAWMKRWLGG
ncbi:MAG TPA: S9 family peptidase [Caulobacteraceae bacterium]